MNQKLLFNKKLFLWHYLIAIVYALIMFYIMTKIDYSSNTYREKTFIFYVLAIIGAPILETILGQLIPFKILQLLKIRNYYINLILLTLFFLGMHNKFNDNTLIIILFGISCSIPVNYFLMTQKIEGMSIATFKTCLLHSVYNTSVIIISFIYSAIF